MAPQVTDRVPYRPGELVAVQVDGVWRRAQVHSVIATTALSEELRFRVLYSWSDGHGPAPAEHCGSDGHGRRLRPATAGMAVGA